MADGEAATAPLVSVLIAAWSAEATLARAIDSVLAQTTPVEVIVIDDASPDGTARVAAAAASIDPRVKLLREVENRGPSAARNRGLSAARAPWITVLDADDYFCRADRLARLLAIAEAEKADFVADDLWMVSEEDPEGPRTAVVSPDPIGVRRLDAAAFIAGNLSSVRGGRHELGFLKPLMSRSFLQLNGLTYDPALRLGEDYVLYARALIAGARFVLTDGAGYTATVRRGSLSGRHPTEAHERLMAADRALLALPGPDAATRRALRSHLMEERKKWAWRRLLDAKRRASPAAAAACFWAHPAVVADLMSRLWGESIARIGRRPGTQ
jgi:hypothetical protein